MIQQKYQPRNGTRRCLQFQNPEATVDSSWKTAFPARFPKLPIPSFPTRMFLIPVHVSWCTGNILVGLLPVRLLFDHSQYDYSHFVCFKKCIIPIWSNLIQVQCRIPMREIKCTYYKETRQIWIKLNDKTKKGKGLDSTNSDGSGVPEKYAIRLPRNARRGILKLLSGLTSIREEVNLFLYYL